MGGGRWLGVVACAALLVLLGYELGRRRPTSAGEAAAVRPVERDGASTPVDSETGEGAPRIAAPRIAIVVDDLGRDLEVLEELEALGVDLTYSVLPFETRTQSVVSHLVANGREFLCHLPMEAQGVADPGPGALTSSMSRTELRRRTRAALEAVPGAVGANNHMGSVLSADAASMTVVLEVLRKEKLFFLDSRTSSETVGFSLARELGLPAAQRQVFLDRDRSVAAIVAQFRRLLEMAAGRGAAVAIGHPYPETLDTLRREIPRAVELGFVFVPISEVLDEAR